MKTSKHPRGVQQSQALGYTKYMLILSNRLLNVPLMSLQTGAQVGITTGVIIDPRELKIVALYCNGQQIGFKPAILHTSDVREFSSIGLIIDSADNIMRPGDLPRLQEVINVNFKLIGKQVVEASGRKVGKVSEYVTDTLTFHIMKLHVQPGFLQSVFSNELLIARTQIKSVDNKKVTVASAEIRAQEPIPKALIENPFRKPRPQTEAIERQVG